MNYPRAPWKDQPITSSGDTTIPAGAPNVEIIPWTPAPWTFPEAIDLRGVNTHPTDPITIELWGAFSATGPGSLIYSAAADPSNNSAALGALLSVEPAGTGKVAPMYPWPFLRVTASNAGANDVVARAAIGVRNLVGGP